MSMTTANQIESMHAMCCALPTTEVKAAHVDDWGRYGNFTVMVTPVAHTRQTTAQLKRLIKSKLPEGAQLRACFPPERIRTSRRDGSSQYNRNYWVFDVDFMRYDAQSNSFS
jgi:hypothetical protein